MTVTFDQPMPKRIAALPTNPAGYPIPWFVDVRSNPEDVNDPDFRVMDPRRLRQAVTGGLCWAGLAVGILAGVLGMLLVAVFVWGCQP